MKEQSKNTRNLKNQGIIPSSKYIYASPTTKLKDMEYCNLADKEFKRTVLNKLNKLQENSESQFTEIRKKIHKQKELFTKEIETIKYNQTEIWSCRIQ